MCDDQNEVHPSSKEANGVENSFILSHEEKDIIIQQQGQEIEELKQSLKELSTERDMLLCEVSKLKFELEMSDLKRLNDDRTGGCSDDRTEAHIVHRQIHQYYTHTNGHPRVNLLHQSQESVVYQEAIPYYGETRKTKQCHHYQSSYSSYRYPRSSSNDRSRCHSPISPSRVRARSNSGSKSTRFTVQEYTYSRYDYCLQISYSSSSNNQKLERPPCGNVTAHAVVHNAHSVHAALPAHLSCNPTSRTSGVLLKKGSVRSNGDILKRSRIQTAYELSQDLLDKRIEMLERKYGGEKARNAALTIQRAFRRYTLLKKFDAITAMAKAERRLSRRLQENLESDANFAEKESQDGSKPQQPRPAPLRSMSMRERRHLDSTPLPRSQSGCCELGHQGIDFYTPTGLQPCIHHTPQLTGSYRDTTYYYTPQEAFTEANHPVPHSPYCSYSCQSLQRDALGRRSTPTVQRSTPSHVHGNSWSRQGSPSPGSYPSRPNSANKKIPPEVPKRTSSISCRSTPDSVSRANGLTKSSENGSLSSVQSSGSDSSLSTDRIPPEGAENDSRTRGSPVWKRKAQPSSPDHGDEANAELPRKELSNTHTSAYQQAHDHSVSDSQHTLYKTGVVDPIRKRQYRVGLNLFNKKPERGIAYLIKRHFLNNTPQAVANFLITKKGLSRQMIGEYLGNLQNEFNMEVLQCFSSELDLSGMQIDVALRKFQTYFRMPGEAQKIERLMEVFSQRYCACNRDFVARLRSPDTVFVLAFAIIMLNTDLHTPNLKPERRMKLDDFIKNLRGIDDCGDIDRELLVGIYERVKANEFKPGTDHVTQVMKVQSTIVGKKLNMALPHRRLVCYCRLYEIPDMYKKERPGVHKREVFLFNDLLVVTKIFSKKKNSVTYTFRESFPLCGMVVSMFEVPYYQYGIRLSQRVDGKVLITFNARNEHDRCKFTEDLRESISEMDEMENLRIEQELERQKSGRGRGAPAENRDSGIADVELCSYSQQTQDENRRPPAENQLKRSALSNSLLDIHEQFAAEKPQQRRGSVGSLDSGMSISFQSTSASTVSRDSSPQNIQPSGAAGSCVKGSKVVNHQQSFLGGLFNKRERKTSRAGQEENCFARTTEV